MSYYSSVVVVHPAASPGVVVASSNPPKRKQPLLAMKAAASSETHHHVLHPAGFGSDAAFSGSRPKFWYLLQGRGGRLFCDGKDGRTPSEAAVVGNCCFGEVVDKDMLEALGMQASPENQARVALRLMHDADKKGQASRYVANLKDTYGYGCSTLCLVYNATGEALHYQKHHNWAGGLFRDHAYPKEVGNGQWAAFLHVHDHNKGAAATGGSSGAVMYRANNFNDKGDRDFLLAWETPSSLMEPRKAYCRVGVASNHEPEWKTIQSQLHKACDTSSEQDLGRLLVDAQIEGVGIDSPTFTAILKVAPSATVPPGPAHQ